MSKTYFPAGKFKISPGLDIYRAQAILALENDLSPPHSYNAKLHLLKNI